MDARLPKVTAVLLTHNRRGQALKRCKELTSQTRPPDDVIVVDNAGRDGTLETIAQSFPGVHLIQLTENTGPAGGFATGFTEAMARGCDFIWAVDDDVVISEGCLEQLVAEARRRPRAVIFPTRVPLEQKHGVAWRGMLIPAEIVRTTGVPRADLFWHLEDTEYFLHRIRDQHGFDVIVTPDAVVWHGTHRPRKGFPGWKLYYQTRNSVYYRFYIKKSVRRRIRTLAWILARTAIVFFREERGPWKAWMMMRGLADGLRGILGKTVDPAIEPTDPNHPDRAAKDDDEEELLKQNQPSPELRAEFCALWNAGLRETSA